MSWFFSKVNGMVMLKEGKRQKTPKQTATTAIEEQEKGEDHIKN
jgi:hypothetical protein